MPRLIVGQPPAAGLRRLARRLRRAGTLARAEGATGVVAVAAAQVLVGRLVTGALPVIGRTGVREPLWPIAGALSALAAGTAALRQRLPIARVAARPPVTRRATVLAIDVVVVVTAAVVGSPSGGAAAVRNGLFLLGVALLAAELLAPALQWLPVAAVAIGSWFLGPGPGQRPLRWAVLLQPSNDPTAAVVTGAALVAGALGLLWGLGPVLDAGDL